MVTKFPSGGEQSAALRCGANTVILRVAGIECLQWRALRQFNSQTRRPRPDCDDDGGDGVTVDGKEVRPVQAIYSSKDRQVLFSSLSLYLERIERYAAHAHEVCGGASVFGVACSTTT